MSFDSYEKLLNDASDILSASTVSQERLKIPKPILMEEGKQTIVRNFMDILDIINRNERDVAKFFMKEFGIGVNVEGRRLIINRKVTEEEFITKLEQYLNVYVRCYECNSPDTEIVKEGRVNVIRCKACGAQHPISPSRELTINRDQIEEGKKYTVTINEIGKSGEGRSKLFGYTIIVPGTKKGQTVLVEVKKIREGTAIAQVVK